MEERIENLKKELTALDKKSALMLKQYTVYVKEFDDYEKKKAKYIHNIKYFEEQLELKNKNKPYKNVMIKILAIQEEIHIMSCEKLQSDITTDSLNKAMEEKNDLLKKNGIVRLVGEDFYHIDGYINGYIIDKVGLRLIYDFERIDFDDDFKRKYATFYNYRNNPPSHKKVWEAINSRQKKAKRF